MKVTNNSDISLALAVWILHDEYDYVNDANYISATKLMRPIRHLVLPDRIPAAQRQAPDVDEFIASALGKSLHDSIEKAWTHGYARALKLMGYPDDVIAHVRINPEKPEPGTIPIYLEQRAKREVVVNGVTYIVGGKYDMVMEGIVMDNKSTTSYTWLYGGKDGDYRLQGSIYKWLNPDKITEDFIRINFIFTDWSAMAARQNPAYPQKRVQHKDIPLLSVEETEQWIKWKLTQVQKYSNAPENQIPECTDEELWRSDPKFKYYADPTKTAGKSTKNFDTLVEANQFWRVDKAGKGIVITVPGEVKRCGYCDAYDACTQKNRYLTP
jgi:hypothetical protein